MGATITARLSVKKLREGKNIICSAAKHNLRELAAERGMDGHINPDQSHLNRVLCGPDSADGVAAFSRELMDSEGIGELRKDAVRGIELVISLPPTGTIDTDQFFDDALHWAMRHFAVPVLSAVVHYDESAPHMHIILLPLIAGRMNGSDLFGDKAKLKRMQNDFYERVARPYGMSKPPEPKRIPAADRKKLAGQILSAIRVNSALLDQPGLKSALLDVLASNPGPAAPPWVCQSPQHPICKATAKPLQG